MQALYYKWVCFIKDIKYPYDTYKGKNVTSLEIEEKRKKIYFKI